MEPIRHEQRKLANGVTLHVASAGDPAAPLMLFLHGFPEFWMAWEAQLQHFGARFHAVAPDLRGFNLSDQPAEVAQYRPKLIMEDIRLLIESCGAKQCVLVAHDWGGAIAWNIAAQLSHLVSKLIIINSPHPATFARDLANDPAQIAASEYMNWLRRPGSDIALAADNFKLIENFLVGMSDASSWFTPAVRAQYHACWARGLLGGTNYYRASPLHPPTASEPGAKAITLPKEMVTVHVPTLVIWGEADQALRTSLLVGLEEFVPNLRIERIAEGSHWIVHEQPERVSRLIGSFIA